MRLQYVVLLLSIVLVKLAQNGGLATDVVNQSSSESSYEPGDSKVDGSVSTSASDSTSDSGKQGDKSQTKQNGSVQSTYADDDDEGSGELSSEAEASENETKSDSKSSVVGKGEEIKLIQSENQTASEHHSPERDSHAKDEQGGASLSGDFALSDKDVDKKVESVPEHSIVPAIPDQNQDTSSNSEEEEETTKGAVQMEDPNVQKASDSIKQGVSGDTIGHVVPTTLDVLLGVVQPTRSFNGDPQTRPQQTQFGRKRSSDDGQEDSRVSSSKYLPTPTCFDVTEKLEWNKDLIGTSSQAAFKIIFGEITTLRSMTNIQAEKTITAAFDVLKDPAAEGINPQEALALYVCEADKEHGRTVYQKLIEYGYLSSLLHPIANKMWGCVKYGHYYDSMGNNPLHLAAKSNSLQVVDFVLRLIKDPIEIKIALEEKNDLNQTPLDVAVDERRPSIIRRFKTTYRTMSNFVKKLDPEAVMEEKKKQKVMTESAALFCKPVLKINSSDEEAVQVALEKGREVSRTINNYYREELSKDSVQRNLRLRKEHDDRKREISSTHRHQEVMPHSTVELSESILEDDIIGLDHGDHHHGNYHQHPYNDLQDMQAEVVDEAAEGGSRNGSDKDHQDELGETSKDKGQEVDEQQGARPKSFLEKVLFWSIIIFCVVFTVVLLLIWFATKI